MSTLEVYDRAADAWSPGPSMGTPRFDNGVVMGGDGRIYTVGGCATADCSAPMRSAEVYTPAPASGGQAAAAGAASGATPPGGCRFELGFKALHDLDQADVGACTDDEGHNPINGDALQHTTTGLLVWRKADNRDGRR